MPGTQTAIMAEEDVFPKTLSSTVSIIIPVHNAQEFIQPCLQSILNQSRSHSTGSLELQISIYDDASTDSTLQIIEDTLKELPPGFSLIISRNPCNTPNGVGYGRNRAIDQSSGDYLCFCDADDVMEPNRIILQYLVASKEPSAVSSPNVPMFVKIRLLYKIVGSCFKRTPPGSTEKFTSWANNLSEKELETQIFLSFGPTLLMPTWFFHRSVWERVGGFEEDEAQGTPEDLLFFYKHLDVGGTLRRLPQLLITYRYHPNATTFSVKSEKIRAIRLQRLEEKVLAAWEQFTIWNAGKSGRRLYRSLSPQNRRKVSALCDVDARKLERGFYEPHPLKEKIPILQPQHSLPPFIICVKTELVWDEGGCFRRILDSLSLVEGVDYYYFN